MWTANLVGRARKNCKKIPKGIQEIFQVLLAEIKIARMVKYAGYSIAVTTKKGWNNARPDSFTLRRIGIHQDMTSTVPLFAARIAGFI